MNILTHLNKEEISCLCAKISMPQEATETVIRLIDTYDFTQVQPYFNHLFDSKVSEEGFESISTILENETEKGYLWLAISLSAALCSYENYQNMGISDEIFYDTMKCFTRFVTEHFDSYGVYGFDRQFWSYRQLSQTIYRIGTLEFELFTQGEDTVLLNGEPIIKKGDTFLSIHIPSDAKINTQNCHESYKLAINFFNKHYPDFKFEYFYCDTWLLSVHLKKVLSESSNILQFQSDFEICEMDDDNAGYKSWVYKDNKLELDDFPENTSLQRNIKKHLQSGGKIGSANGIIRKRLFES